MNQRKKRGQGKKSKSTKDSSASPLPPAIVVTKPIPEFLLKRGITRVTRNIPEGKEIRLPPKTFALFFGEEILQALKARRMSREKDRTTKKKAKSKKQASGLKKKGARRRR